MSIVAEVVIYIMMVFVVVGVIGAIRNPEEGMGAEFLSGLHAIGYLFIPISGIMASIPYLKVFVEDVIGPVWGALGADPAVAAGTFIASDMGGYQLAIATGSPSGSWIMALLTGYMAGATLVFSIPVGLAMLAKRDHQYLALGVMAGVLTIPVGVGVGMIMVYFSGLTIRPEAVTVGPSDTPIEGLTLPALGLNLIPITVFVVLIAAGLRFFPRVMIRLFMIFGKFIDIAVKIVLAASIVEYFTGFFSWIFGSWGFDPIIADEVDPFRALEVAGNVGIMLAGAFPMVYAMRKYLSRPLSFVGNRVGISDVGVAGILAASANILATFRLIRNMDAKNKVLSLAFAVTGAFLLGDHLSFTANFQPNLIVPVLVGKTVAAFLAVGLALLISVPIAQRLEREQQEEGSQELLDVGLETN